MKESKTPRLAWVSALALVMAGGLTLAACGGGDDGLSQAQEEALQEALDDAQAERDEARRREQEAERRRLVEEQRRQQEEQARQQAEEDREAAEEERDELQDQITQINARFALDGFRPVLRRTLTRIGEDHTATAGDDNAASVEVQPRHGQTALITPTPSWGFSTAQRSSASGWTVTTHTNSGHNYDDELVVYDDRGGPVSIPLVQEFRGGSRFLDGDGANAGTEITGGITDTDGQFIRSGSFPSADGTDRTLAHNHDSDHTMDSADDNNPDTPEPDGNLTNDFDRARVSGTFMGASGHFVCEGTCTIGRRGNRYDIISGTWTFVTTDRANARIDDRSYAYFGWWQRERRENETYSYHPFAAVADPATTGGGQTLTYSATVGGGTAFNLLSGSASYRGPAIGQYATYQPLNGQSGAGAFTADAEFTANFNNNMVSGTVTNFSNDADWSLTLNLVSMAGGQVDDAGRGGVDWTIAGTGTSDVQGRWDAEFYSESNYVGQVPDGVVGTFTAAFDGDINNMEDFDDIVGSIIGAFGADKQ